MSGWKGCKLVSPLCPNDLCELEEGHPGTKQGKHCLGTDCIGDLHKYVGRGKKMYMSETATTAQELIEEGYQRSVELGWRP